MCRANCWVAAGAAGLPSTGTNWTTRFDIIARLPPVLSSSARGNRLARISYSSRPAAARWTIPSFNTCTTARRVSNSRCKLRTIASNTGFASGIVPVSDARISPVAIWWSRASFSSRVSTATRSCRLALDARAVGALRVLGLLLRRPLGGRLPPLCRCMSVPWAGSRRCPMLGKFPLSRH